MYMSTRILWHRLTGTQHHHRRSTVNRFIDLEAEVSEDEDEEEEEEEYGRGRQNPLLPIS